ncbi:MAG TPA: hypothetical protein VLV83_14320, partial [Acidobacteriota bacterium]|nr:hypothetical protein [Acidobacteriota bacterium]
CQVGISHYWDRSPDTQPELRHKIEGVLENIRNGSFARHLLKQQEDGYPELKDWHRRRSSALVQSEERLRKLLRGPKQGES